VKPAVEYRRGARTAAAVADSFNSSTTHPNRLGDCILIKLNLKKMPPRRNRQAIKTPKASFAHGMGLALAEMHRKTGARTAVVEVAREAGLTYAELRDAGVDAYDLKELRRAGVR
jgi:hypothetical protein